MKKLVFLLILGIIILASNGCGDPINPPEPPVVIKQQFKITTTCGPNGTISPTDTVVDSGRNATLTPKPAVGYMVNDLKVDGTVVPSITKIYSIYNVTSDKKVEVTFKKDSLLFPLLRITWKQNAVFSLMNGEWIQWDDPMEIVDFTSDGSCTQLWNGNTYTGYWSLDKSKNPAILVYNGRHCTIETLTEDKLSISSTNTQGIITRKTYVNGGYKK